MQLNTVSSLLPPGQLFPVASTQPSLPRPAERPAAPVANTPVAPSPPVAVDENKAPESPQASIFGSDTFSMFRQYAGQSASGAAAAFQLGERTSGFFREISKAFEGSGNGWTQARPGIEGAVMSGVHGAGIGALVSAGVALVSHGYQTMQGEISVEELSDHVLTDALSGAFAGFGGATLGGAGHLIMSSMGMAGLPLKIGTAIAGAVGGVLLAQMSQPMEDTPSQQKKQADKAA
jgi:hypothetical protein